MARTCVWCGDPLPEPTTKGHRRREFCPRPKSCKQLHYLWHKQMKEDTTKLAEPYWRTAYMLLAEHYKLLEQMLQARVANLTEAQKRTEELEEHVKFHKDRYEALQADYVARLKALGMSQKDIEEFDTYWKAPKEY